MPRIKANSSVSEGTKLSIKEAPCVGGYLRSGSSSKREEASHTSNRKIQKPSKLIQRCLKERNCPSKKLLGGIPKIRLKQQARKGLAS
jgi:hypothetical protein